MRVSNNSIQTFKRCRRLWELQYRYCLKSTAIAPALETGLTYHEKVDQLLSTGSFKMDSDPKTNAMVLAFQKYVLPQLDREFKTEEWFEHNTKAGNLVVGRYDGISDNYLLEHKTTSSRIDGAYWASLELEEQILTYMLASGRRKIVYTVCQKPTIRQSVNETAEEFQKRCVNWFDSDTRSKIGFQIIVRNDDEIKQFEQELDLMCKEIENCSNFYRNTCQCNRWGRPCEFMPICKNYDPNKSYVGFERKE